MLTTVELAAFALAAGAGGLLRFVVTQHIAEKWGVQFPLATLVVNGSGALLVGFLAGLCWQYGTADLQSVTAWQLSAIAFCGSYTTVSSFSLQTLSLWQSHQHQQALYNILLTFSLGIILAGCGYALALSLC